MSAGIWIIIGIVVLAVCCGRGTKARPSGGGAVRTDRPHYYDPDEYECSACGARFGKRSMVCPKCGARFTGTREDSSAFEEEMLEVEDWDEDEE